MGAFERTLSDDKIVDYTGTNTRWEIVMTHEVFKVLSR